MKKLLIPTFVALLMAGCGSSEEAVQEEAEDDPSVPLAIPCIACGEKVSKVTKECRQCGHPTPDSVVAYKEAQELARIRVEEERRRAQEKMPPVEETIRVIAQQWAWTFVHPGKDGKLDTYDDVTIVDELHLEVNTTYHYELSTRDVLHCFSIPALKLEQDAVLGRTIKGWFRSTATGKHDIQCAEMCGRGHAHHIAALTIHTKEDYAKWLENQFSEEKKDE